MQLRGRQGTELGLTIAGYGHPDEQVDPWDSNVLEVAVRVVAPQGAWEVVDPCLTTWEAARVVRWLSAVGRGADVASGGALTLAEPNITLWARTGEDSPGRVDLRACFALETRPPWVRSVAGAADLCVDIDAVRADLLAAAADLARELERFPQRGEDPNL